MEILNKAVALAQLEAKALEFQQKFADIGLRPFLFIVTLEPLQDGYAGVHYPDTETVAISQDYFAYDPVESINQTLPHELAHLYVEKYFPGADGNDIHGSKFMEVLGMLVAEPSAYHSMPYYVPKAIVK